MNTQNRIPVSVRIAQEDADFIAALEMEGAYTPSEKIRELLKQARMAHTQVMDYDAALQAAERLFYETRHNVLRLEKQHGIHSNILARVFELLPDLTATVAAVLPDDADGEVMRRYEREVMWRVIRLMDAMLQLAVTGKGAAYDDSVLKDLENTLKLAEIVRQVQAG